MGLRRVLPLIVAAWLSRPGTAHAVFHLMRIVEVFPGTEAAPNAQYVVLQMYSAGQTLVSGHQVTVHDASGAIVAQYVFSANVANGANQSRILIATTQAQTFFGVTADLLLTPTLPLTGGKVCFANIDCVGWGSYAPVGGDVEVGTPFNSPAAPVAGAPGPGLVRGRAIQRRLDIFGGPTTLQAGDDTDQCAANFVFGPPAPRNNADQVGTIPASTCGNTAIEGLEGCDDGNLTAGDGCGATCAVEFCGDAAPGAGEACDDGNLMSGDGCDINCTITACGNSIITAGEGCDDGNLISADGCDANCTVTACGNGIATAGEACDDGNPISGDGCDANCTVTACGNGIVTTGEACDDGNLVDADGCDSNCTVAGCGNGVITAPEACDDSNLISGDGCDANCTVTACGNGIPTAGEVCDDGNLVDGDGCDANCTITACGNGIVTAGEQCEPPATGACDPTCQLGCVDAGGCVDADPCTAARCDAWTCMFDPVDVDDGEDCTTDACGGGGPTHTAVADATACVVDPAGTPGSCAGGICAAPACGDGVVDAGEACDDGNVTAGDGCSAACANEDTGSGGCCSTGRAPDLPAILLAGLGLVSVLRRRRRDAT